MLVSERPRDEAIQFCFSARKTGLLRGIKLAGQSDPARNDGHRAGKARTGAIWLKEMETIFVSPRYEARWPKTVGFRGSGHALR